MLFFGTEVPLGDAGTWSSDVDSYPGYVALTNYQMTVQGTLFSDQNGTLFIDQGGDVISTTQYGMEINWDYTIEIDYTGGTGIDISEAVVSPYLRLRYVNGSTPQTVFRLLVSLNNTGSGEPG
jgi:hypothetical protein